jgi:hypothetical protein
MAICKIISPNLPLESGVEIISTTFDVTALPADNLLHPNLWAFARSASGGADQHVTFDLGAAQTVRGLAILAHTIPSSPTTLRFAGSDSDAWTSPASGWLTLTWHADKIIGFFDADKTYRYWRLEISASAQFDIGGLVFGPVWQSPHQGYGQFRRSEQTLQGGRVDTLVYDLTLEQLTQDDSDAVAEIHRRHRQRRQAGPYYGGSRPTLFCFDVDNEIVPDGLQDRSVYGVISGGFSADLGVNNYDTQPLRVEECK